MQIFNQTMLSLAILGISGSVFSQVEIDQSIQLTGGAGMSAITGLTDPPVNGTDAVNKDYVDTTVSASGSGGPTMISTESATAMSFGDALRYCNALTESSYTDWRMPTFNELTVVISTGGVSVPSNSSTNSVWFVPVNIGYSGGDMHATSGFTFSSGSVSGSYGGGTGGGVTRRVRCVR
jgi:hypothetical protein